MYDEIVDSIYDVFCNRDASPKIEKDLERVWETFDNNPNHDTALSVGAMFELRGFYLGFEAAMNLVLKK